MGLGLAVTQEPELTGHPSAPPKGNREPPLRTLRRMKVVLPGGTGQVGQMLTRALLRDGHEVVAVSRNPAANARCRTVQWDGRTVGEWRRELDGADAVINLAGRSVNCRYHRANREAILQSRVNSTRAVGLAIQQTRRPPRVWLQASTATIYSHRFDAPNDDVNGVIGGTEADMPAAWRFSIEVAEAWEKAALDVGDVPQTRRVLLRSAMTMSPDLGGIFDTLLHLVRYGLGGHAGNGRQYVSWIHERDFVRAVYWLIERSTLEGAVNIAAPVPVPNEEFMRALRKARGIRLGLPAANWMLEIGALLLSTETELILKSRRVVPRRLLGEGFTFEFPEWLAAAEELCARWR